MNNKESLCIHSKTIERVTQFAYLGSIIDNTGGKEADITAHIWKAQTAFSALNKIWHSMAYSMQTKLRIFNTNVKAVLHYNCETWKNSKSITAKLLVFINPLNAELNPICHLLALLGAHDIFHVSRIRVNKCLRKIVRIFWPDQIKNKELWKHTKQSKIDLQIRKCKWGWLGHKLRKRPTILPGKR